MEPTPNPTGPPDPPPKPPFDVVDGQPRFRGLEVVQLRVEVGGQPYELAALRDAADLLDQPDYAERFVHEDVAPYGMELWPAATMLAEHLLEQPPGAGRLAVELGCGLGLVSLVAAAHGWRVEATDYEETALRFARYNAERNGVPLAGVAHLDWRNPPRDRRFDLVLAADVLYQLVDHEPVLASIDALLAPAGVALIADPCRGVADRFAALAAEHGYDVTQTKRHAPGPGQRQVQGRIFQLRPQS